MSLPQHPAAVALMLVLAGCASGESTATSTPGAGADVTSSAPAGTDVTLTIRSGKVSPELGRVSVRRGERVRLTVTSDVADEVHVHGVDREIALAAGRPATLTFVADQVGLFEVETHESELVLFQLLVR